VWLAEYVSRNVDILLVGRLLTTTETGVYTVAQRTSTLPPMVLVAFNAFFSPTVSALYATGQLEELRATFRRASLWIMIVSAPVLGMLMALATPVMAFFGREFTGGALALWILCLGQFVNVGVGLISVVLTMVDRQQTVLACNVAGLAVSAGLCWVLIPRYGILGAAVATTTLQVLVPAALSIFAYRYVGVSPFSRSYPKPLLAALAAGLATHALAALLPGALVQLLIGGVVFVALYAAGMVALGEKEEALRAFRALREAAQRGSVPGLSPSGGSPRLPLRTPLRPALTAATTTARRRIRCRPSSWPWPRERGRSSLMSAPPETASWWSSMTRPWTARPTVRARWRT